MRKLASIQIIKDVNTIPDADRIELVSVLGWQCVAKKGEFQKGDYCVYFEIDSFLPIKPEFEFLRASSFKKSPLLGEGFRLKTQTMRGEISQGLCLPVSIVEELGWYGLPEGTDVTELLGVRKWEIPETATTGGTVIATLPGFIPSSDETRIQTIPEILDEFGDMEYYISTKMDGSSHAIGLDSEDRFYVCGHNYQYKDDGKCSFYQFIKKREFEEKLRQYKKDNNLVSVVLIGEFCGAGIQKNRLKLQKPQWFVFTVNIDERRASLEKAQEVAAFIGADFVPVEEIDTGLKQKYPDIKALLARADGTYPNGGAKEGIVIRPTVPVASKVLNGESLSFKVLNNRYLLKHGE